MEQNNKKLKDLGGVILFEETVEELNSSSQEKYELLIDKHSPTGYKIVYFIEGQDRQTRELFRENSWEGAVYLTEEGAGCKYARCICKCEPVTSKQLYVEVQ